MCALALLLLASGCAPRGTERLLPPPTSIQPLTPTERINLLQKLRSGQPIPVDSVLEPPPAVSNALVISPNATSISNPAAPTQQDECAQFRAQLGPSFIQGYLTVPEDWNQPSGTRIQVYYYARLQRDAQGAILRPVIFFNGGPSADSHSSYDILEHRSGAQTLSMIYLDQRGTGCSDPYPTTPQDAATAKRLTLYGSRAIVRDAEALRARLLGARTPWAAFGQSYGGEIVHRYLEIAPDGLSAAYAHGAAIVSDPVTKVIARLSSQLRVSRDYFAQFTGDDRSLQALRAQIPATRCFDDGMSRVCGPAIFDALTVLLGFRTQWDSLHEWVSRLVIPATGKLDEKTLAKYVRTFVFGVYASNGFAASVLSYREIVPGYTDSGVCQVSLDRLKQGGASAGDGDPMSWPINECRLLLSLHAPWDGLIAGLGAGDGVSLEGVASQLARLSGLRFFLYSGGLDAFVPVSIFGEETARLGGRVKYTNFPDSGHDGFYSEQQVWDDLNSG